MGILDCHFCENSCEGASIKKCSSKIWCCCKYDNEEEEDENHKNKGVIYVNTTGIDQFVLLQTPFIECKEWMVLDDIPFNTTTMFFRDPNGDIRAAIHHEPHDIRHRMSSIDIEDQTCNIHEGILVESILPNHLKIPILRFMEDTLDGTFYQMHGLFNSAAKLIRTFPIFDYNNTVVGGLMIIGPFTPTFNQELQQFVLNDRETVLVPDRQNMDNSDETIDNEPIPQYEFMPPTKHMGLKKKKCKTI